MYPSGSAIAIPLGPTNPWLIIIAKETLVFSACEVLTHIAVTCANILTSQRSTMPHGFGFTAVGNALLPLLPPEGERNPQLRYYA